MLIALLACTATPAEPAHYDAPPIAWQTLLPGLELADVPMPVRSHAGDSIAHIVRVTPGAWTVALRSAATNGGNPRPVDQWFDTGAVAAINPGMFGSDWLTSTGHMVSDGVVTNAAWTTDNSVIAASGDRFHIFNLECEGRPDDTLWPNMIQSIRMMDCAGNNVWADQPKEWSASVVGDDHKGRLLLIHVRSPYRMHALVDQLKAMPLGLRALHYGDGGPPSFLSVRTPSVHADWVGSWETGAFEDDGNASAGNIPNVLVVVPASVLAPEVGPLSVEIDVSG